jgi:hypothetical protein
MCSKYDGPQWRRACRKAFSVEVYHVLFSGSPAKVSRGEIRTNASVDFSHAV